MWQAGPCVFVLYYTPLGAWETQPPAVVFDRSHAPGLSVAILVVCFLLQFTVGMGTWWE